MEANRCLLFSLLVHATLQYAFPVHGYGRRGGTTERRRRLSHCQPSSVSLPMAQRPECGIAQCSALPTANHSKTLLVRETPTAPSTRFRMFELTHFWNVSSFSYHMRQGASPEPKGRRSQKASARAPSLGAGRSGAPGAESQRGGRCCARSGGRGWRREKARQWRSDGAFRGLWQASQGRRAGVSGPRNPLAEAWRREARRRRRRRRWWWWWWWWW